MAKSGTFSRHLAIGNKVSQIMGNDFLAVRAGNKPNTSRALFNLENRETQEKILDGVPLEIMDSYLDGVVYGRTNHSPDFRILPPSQKNDTVPKPQKADIKVVS